MVFNLYATNAYQPCCVCQMQIYSYVFLFIFLLFPHTFFFPPPLLHIHFVTLVGINFVMIKSREDGYTQVNDTTHMHYDIP